MGIIYKAYDTVMKREVAVKTIVDAGGPAAAEMFHKEWGLQASVIHPNVVEIYDIGDFEEDGAVKPYFVMPLLPGKTLGQLIQGSSERLPVERSVDIICQTCRGLQAAHERGLVHRDLKPTNIFVMDDDSVKIIDFGLVHSEHGKSTVGVKGTLPYMAPELLQMQPPSVLTDIFALGAVCYEALTGRRAFDGSSDSEISRAILYGNPPPANEMNRDASESIARVIHKAMAKHPWHRFSSAREFGETLQKALHNEPLEFFDPVRVLARADRAAKAFERGEHQIAGEILGELEAEGHIEPEIARLRRRIDEAMRQINIEQLLKSARQLLAEEEYLLSLRKIQEALEIDAKDESALALRNEVESNGRKNKIGNPSDTGALEMLAEVDRRNSEYGPLREQKAELYVEAVEAWRSGEVNTALVRLERWMWVDGLAPDDNGERESCQDFYKQVQSECEAIEKSCAEGRKLLAERNFAAALAVCEPYLCKYPRHALFQALKSDIEDRKTQSISPVAAETDSGLAGEPVTEGAPQPRQRGRRAILLGLSCTVLVLGGGAYTLLRSRPPAVTPVPVVRMELRTKPAGAILKIDGKVRGASNLQLDLTPGVHSITAELEGYQPASATVTPGVNERASALDMVLLPSPVTLRVYSDAEGAAAWLDETSLTAIQEGEFVAEGLTPGTHSFRLSNRKGRVSMSLELAAGKPPVIAVPFDSKGIQVALVNQYASHTWIYCNDSAVKVGLDNRPPGTLDPSGVHWADVTPGAHDLKVNDGKSERKFVIHSGLAPSVTAFVYSKAQPDTGVLSISAGEDDVNVYLNNILYRRTTQQGELRIPDLAVTKKYDVRVSKDGYDGGPAQTVSLSSGSETKVTFQLKVAARMATLQIMGGQPGARVLVDEKPVGVIAPDGAFLGDVTPGSHSIQLRKDASKSKKVARSFTEGNSTLVPGPDLPLELLPGTLRFQVSPPNSHITLRLKSDPDLKARSIGQESITAPEGSYVVSASAPGYAGSVTAVSLPAGGNVLVEIALTPIESPREKSPVEAVGMANWEEPGNWTRDGQWYIHKSASFVPYHASPVNGAFTFEAMALKGKRLQWAINRSDDKNYVFCRLDKKYFERSEIANGKIQEQIRVEHNLTDPLTFTMKIDISANRVQHSVMRSGEWVVLDSWTVAKRISEKGKFGFIIPWRDEIAVTSFVFSPREAE